MQLGGDAAAQLARHRKRHIPVQIITLDEDRQHGMARGALVGGRAAAVGSGRVSAAAAGRQSAGLTVNVVSSAKLPSRSRASTVRPPRASRRTRS